MRSNLVTGGTEGAAQSKEMAYYANGKLPCLALIARGVRSSVSPRALDTRGERAGAAPHVQELVADLFEAPAGTTIPLVKLSPSSTYRSSNAELSKLGWCGDAAISRLETLKQIPAERYPEGVQFRA